MQKNDSNNWIPLDPKFGRFRSAREHFLSYARQLRHWSQVSGDAALLNNKRGNFLDLEKQLRREIWPTLKAAGLLLNDLVEQGWSVRIRSRCIEVLPSVINLHDRQAEKELTRRQELIKRNVQLKQDSVQQFIRSMECRRLFGDQFVSVFSLMRDGRELAASLRHAAKHSSNGNSNSLFDSVQPYLEFVNNKKKCKFTGLKLMGIWRYFRHTWTNQYTSVPGRTMMCLVRDAAAPFHPVIGIAALSSPIIQLGARDKWIGWHPDTFIEDIKSHPTTAVANWLVEVIDNALGETYVSDFLKEGLITRRKLKIPNEEVIKNLLEEGGYQRKLHHRYTDRGQYKETKQRNHTSRNIWKIKAQTYLFRSKRAYALASYLQVRMTLNKYFGGKPNSVNLSKLLQHSDGKNAIRKIVRKAKADSVGIAMADISVCGAIAPYNEILGGKLVSMLMTSPEVIKEYKQRYGGVESEIASSMAGRPITRPAKLVYLGTTSLYGSNSSQYNRIKIPSDIIGSTNGSDLKYIRLGKSESFGTSHYSHDTVEALVSLVQHSKGGQRVNSIFGEGSSPKLRKVREGLDVLGFLSEKLLQHGRKRIIYGIPLVSNAKEFLLGYQKRPRYLYALNTSNATQQICEWWMLRWLKRRIQNEDVINSIERHNLVEPIIHGARVPQIYRAEQHETFNDDNRERYG